MSVRIKRASPEQSGEVLSYSDLSSNDGMEIPHVSRELVLHLRRVFPPKVAPHYSLRDYDVMVGEKNVIDYLENLFNQQSTT